MWFATREFYLGENGEVIAADENSTVENILDITMTLSPMEGLFMPQGATALRAWWKRVTTDNDFAPCAFLLVPWHELEKIRSTANVYKDLHGLSSDICHFILFYDGIPLTISNRDYIRELGLSIWEMTDDAAKEYGKANAKLAYEIAKYFSIPFEDLPCIVFFNDIEDTKRVAILKIRDESPDAILKELERLCTQLLLHAKNYYKLAEEIRTLTSQWRKPSTTEVERVRLQDSINELKKRIRAEKQPIDIIVDYARNSQVRNTISVLIRIVKDTVFPLVEPFLPFLKQ